MKRRSRLTDGHIKSVMTVNDSSGGGSYVDD
jgi:hypothetical protein